jgi:hypothetical protein
MRADDSENKRAAEAAVSSDRILAALSKKLDLRLEDSLGDQRAPTLARHSLTAWQDAGGIDALSVKVHIETFCFVLDGDLLQGLSRAKSQCPPKPSFEDGKPLEN